MISILLRIVEVSGEQMGKMSHISPHSICITLVFKRLASDFADPSEESLDILKMKMRDGNSRWSVRADESTGGAVSSMLNKDDFDHIK